MPGPRKKKILVVADESDTRVFLSNLLGGGGFESIGAGNMREGLDMAKKHRPALIILDVMLANKEGIQMYCYLKNDRTLRCVPVIMLSAIDRETFFLYEKFKASKKWRGVPEPEAYMEKPPEADDLLRLVRTLTAGAMADGHGFRAGSAPRPDR